MRAFGRAVAAGCIVMLAAAALAVAAGRDPRATPSRWPTRPIRPCRPSAPSCAPPTRSMSRPRAGLRPTVSVSGSYTYQNQQISTPSGGLSARQSPAHRQRRGHGQPAALHRRARPPPQSTRRRPTSWPSARTCRRTEISVLQNVVGAYLDVRRDQEQLAISQDNVNGAGAAARGDQRQVRRRRADPHRRRPEPRRGWRRPARSWRRHSRRWPRPGRPTPRWWARTPASSRRSRRSPACCRPRRRRLRRGRARQSAAAPGGLCQEQASAARLAEAKAQTRPTVSLQRPVRLCRPAAGCLAAASARRASRRWRSSVGGTRQRQRRRAALHRRPQRLGDPPGGRAGQRQPHRRRERARRQVLQAVSQAWNQLLGARASLVADEEQVRSDTVAYEGVPRGAEGGPAHHPRRAERPAGAGDSRSWPWWARGTTSMSPPPRCWRRWARWTPRT